MIVSSLRDSLGYPCTVGYISVSVLFYKFYATISCSLRDQRAFGECFLTVSVLFRHCFLNNFRTTLSLLDDHYGIIKSSLRNPFV